MDENQNPKKPKEVQENNPTLVKLQAIKAVKQLSNGDSKWNLTQEIFQEIQAGHIISNPNVKPKVTTMLVELRAEIAKRYSDNEELRDLLLASIPADVSVRAWLKKPEWEEAVWSKIRTDELFSPQNRAKVIKSVMDRALDKSDAAAKLWLTLSGDYSEKMEINDKTIDTFREINSILHKKKEE